MRRQLLSSTAVLTALLAGVPAFADQERRGPHGQGGGGEKHAQAQSAPRVEGRAVERAVPRQNAPVVVAPRVVQPTVVAPRVVRPTVVAPRVVRPGVVAPVYPYGGRPYVARPYVAHGYYAPYHYYARPYYTGPYYFRPRFTIGFGIYAGYPVPYAYGYPYPVPVYGYAAPSTPVVVGPSSTQYGGVALELSPSDASVYVDGGYAGLVRDFDGSQRTLTLATGRHQIEINAPGYEPMTLEVDTVPGQIVPYRGDLQAAR